MNLRKYSTDPSALSDQCKAIMSSSDESKYLFRVFAVNMVLSGISASQVAGSVGLSKATVTGWVKRVDESGFDSLRPQQHPGRQSKLTEVQLNELAGIIPTDPTKHGFNVWDGSSLSSYIRSQYSVDIGIRQCQRVFRSLDDMHIRFPSYQVNNKNADDGLKFLSRWCLHSSAEGSICLVHAAVPHYHSAACRESRDTADQRKLPLPSFL